LTGGFVSRIFLKKVCGHYLFSLLGLQDNGPISGGIGLISTDIRLESAGVIFV